MHVPTIYIQLISLSAIFLSACSIVPMQVDYVEQADQDIKQVSVWSQHEAGQKTTYLNELISSPQLDGLLAEALAANPGLQQTLITLKIRRAEQRQTNAGRRPEVDAGFSAARQEDENTTYTGSLSVSWEADLWQKLGDNINAAELDVAEQQALYQSARNTLSAEVMKTWLGLIAQQHTINIGQRRLQSLQQNEQFILQRYRSGLGNLEDLDSARSSVASSQASLEAQQESFDQQQHSLQVLLGQTDKVMPDISLDYPAVIIPLAELPEQTLQQRGSGLWSWLTAYCTAHYTPRLAL